ncbi:MAG: hypothetical protein ABI720_02130 [Actinomycetes bacterium]
MSLLSASSVLAGSFGSAAEVVVALGVGGLLIATAIGLVGRDGYGQRPAPRSIEDWSANELPSRPYGV